MRKVITGMCLLLAFAMTTNAADPQKALEKARSKQCKAKIKEYKKEGWKLAATSKSIDVALLEHYAKLSNADNSELVGDVSRCQSANMCKQAAYNNAILTYANLAGSAVKGRIVADGSLNQTTGDEFDKLYVAYERLVQAEIKNVAKESYSVVKEYGNEKQYRTFFIVNEDDALKARIRAMEMAAKETALAQQYANQVVEFVREGFAIEQ